MLSYNKIKSRMGMVLGIKKAKKFALLAVTSALLLFSIIGPSNLPNKAFGEGSGTPRFNFLPGDLEMLQVAKTTDNVWGDPINSNVGERVAFLFYYHNGMLNTTAHNTTLKVTLPTGESNQLVATSSLSSTETAPISDTIVDGQIVGQSGATIKLPSNGSIEYVSGSTKWFPEGTQTPTAVADGITGAGLNIGSINGCWPYAGFVTFLADIKAPIQPAGLVLDKLVAHPGESAWHQEITAHPGDDIAYRLGVINNGGTVANQVTVKDIIPSHMTYTPGTTFIFTKDHPEGIAAPDTIFTSGISLPDVMPGQENMIHVTYRTRVDMNLPAGTFNLINLAKVFMAGILKDQATAKVTVMAERGLTIDKKVSNGVSWVEQSTAKLGDTISYRIIVKNTGNTPIDSVFVRDVLPVFVVYTNGSTKVDGTTVGDAIITSNGLALGSIPVGGQRTITLSGSLHGCPPAGGFTLVNTAFGRATSVAEISDSASTFVNIGAPTAPGM